MNEMSERLQVNTQLTATLEAAEWNVVFQALNDVAMPMRIVRPVFDRLLAQFNQPERRE